MELISNVVKKFSTKDKQHEKEEETFRFVFDDYFGNQVNYYKFVKVVPTHLINYLINTLGEKELTDAVLGGGIINPIKRRSKVFWLPKTVEFLEIYNLFFELLNKCNNEFYHFRITEMAELIQYTVYNSTDQGHYDWHLDVGPEKANRKLSLVCNLTDPNEYEGGELQLHLGNIVVPEREKGTVIIFPSYLLHRVTPVTKGTRRTLVLWINGPSFT